MLFVKKNKILNELGFYIDQDGILDRYYQEESGWNTHLENTKKYICKSAEKINGESAAILGSGWLLDIPLKELSEKFKEVHLFDIIHPKEIKQKIKRYKNVYCFEKDLTGGYINAVYDLFQNNNPDKKITLDTLGAQSFNLTEKYDFICSVNILNQLDILLVDYIRQYNKYNEIELNEFRKLIQKQHIDSLPKGKTCLITDYEEIIFEKEIITEKKKLIFTTIPDNSEKEQWQWNFDSRGTYNKGKKTVFNVMALNI